MTPMLIAAALVTGYLAGSLAFTRIVARWFAPQVKIEDVVVRDPETGAEYSRAPNATTASMALGWRAGCLISLLDMAKTVVPVLVWMRLFPGSQLHLVAALGVLAGNNWPLFFGFSGGSGLSSIYGGLLLIDPLAIPVTVGAGFVIGMIALRSMMLTFVLPLVFLIPWFWVRTGEPWHIAYAVLVNVLYLITFARDARPYLTAGKRISERAVMEQMPMGRGMLKMLERMGLSKK